MNDTYASQIVSALKQIVSELQKIVARLDSVASAARR